MPSQQYGSVKSKIVISVTATGIVLTLSASTILTPLWLDSVGNTNYTKNTNNSHDNTNKTHRVDSFTIILIVDAIFCVLSFIGLIIRDLCSLSFRDSRHENPPRVHKYPKSELLKFFWIGFSDALSSIVIVYASSGTRTAPYLQSIAINFSIPATFIIRFIILKKRPTCRKFTCAVLVLIAEFVALIPQIFSLESISNKAEDGGAPGIGGILWPLCYFIGFIPRSVVTVVIEKSAKSKYVAPSGGSENVPTIDILFWCYFFSLLVVVCLFWTNLIPEFGSTSGLNEFYQVFLFNIKCFFGIEDCVMDVHIYSPLCIAALLINRFLSIIFLRYAEGANYLSIIMSLQTPLVLMFWTLFDEDPFHWHPHLHLSTILSIVAVVIILPSIYFYNTGPPEISLQQETAIPVDKQTCSDRDDLYIQFMNSNDSMDGGVQ